MEKLEIILGRLIRRKGSIEGSVKKKATTRNTVRWRWGLGRVGLGALETAEFKATVACNIYKAMVVGLWAGAVKKRSDRS